RSRTSRRRSGASPLLKNRQADVLRQPTEVAIGLAVGALSLVTGNSKTGGQRSVKKRPMTGNLTKGVVRLTVEKPESDFAVNLRRLIYFHHWSAREAAKILGVSEHAISA